MKQHEFILGSLLALEHGEVFTQLVALDEGMCHFDPLGLHRVLLAEVVVGNRVVVEVAHLTHSKLYTNASNRLYFNHTMQDQQQLYPFNDDQVEIAASVSNPVEKKSTISSFTVYTVKAQDKEGTVEQEKRYSDFDHVRIILANHWPGCFIPPLPPKKMIGNTAHTFIEERCLGLDIFLKNMAKLKHLWYSKEFQLFLRGTGDLEKQFKSLPHETQEDIIKKYDEAFPKLNGKSQDTATLARVLQFYTYCKKILPTLENFKDMSLSFIQAKNANNQQFSVLLNYVLPKYEETCLSVYCNKLVEGKYIFNEQNDKKLIEYLQKFKQMISEQQFEELYRSLELEGREIEAFLEIYKTKDHYDSKLKDLKSKEKDLQLEITKLNAGKQGMFNKLVSKLEDSKAKANASLETTKEEIKVTSFVLDLLVTLMGYFEIPRFRKDKLQKYFQTVKKIAKFQMEFTELKGKICEHVLDNHNLL